MATKAPDLTGYNLTEKPGPGIVVEVICQDRYGTYNPPFHCLWQDGSWLKSETATPVEIDVLGWRAPRRPPRKPFRKPSSPPQ